MTPGVRRRLSKKYLCQFQMRIKSSESPPQEFCCVSNKIECNSFFGRASPRGLSLAPAGQFSVSTPVDTLTAGQTIEKGLTEFGSESQIESNSFLARACTGAKILIVRQVCGFLEQKSVRAVGLQTRANACICATACRPLSTR